MPKIFLLLTLFIFAPGARASTDSQTEKAYYNCVNFLKLSPARQAKAAAHSGYGLAQVRWACQMMKRNGLEKSQRAEREYQRDIRRGGSSGGGGGGYSAPTRPRSCLGAISCGGNEHCVDRVCVSKTGNHCANSGLHTCSTGEKCINDVCQ